MTGAARIVKNPDVNRRCMRPVDWRSPVRGKNGNNVRIAFEGSQPRLDALHAMIPASAMRTSRQGKADSPGRNSAGGCMSGFSGRFFLPGRRAASYGPYPMGYEPRNGKTRNGKKRATRSGLRWDCCSGDGKKRKWIGQRKYRSACRADKKRPGTQGGVPGRGG